MQKAILWDRDGTINRVVPRPNNPISCPYSMEEFELLPNVLEVLKQTHNMGYKNIVVTNQPDVKYGKPSLVNLNQIHKFLIDNCYIEECLFCSDKDSCNYKPNPGMLEDVIARHFIDPCVSFMIGDRWKDIVPGHEVGLNTVFFGDTYICPNDYDHIKPDYLIKDIRDLVPIVR